MSATDRIRELLNASTPGPWWSGLTTSDERIVAFVSDGTGETHDDIHAEMHVARDEGEPNANGLLIAEMRAALPALLDVAEAAGPAAVALRALAHACREEARINAAAEADERADALERALARLDGEDGL